MSKIVVTTDSTANLPAELVKEYNIPSIPLNVHWGDASYKDGETLDTATFYRWLQERSDFPKTSQPSTGEFMQFFQNVAQTHQTDTIISILLSSGLSGTVDSALQARARLPNLNIEIVDSLSASMGTGLQVLAAARAVRQGANLTQVLEATYRARQTMQVLFVVDTLEYLHRGGRIGGAARLMGTLLSLKPILTIKSGYIEAVQKVRSRRKSLLHMLDVAAERLNGQTLKDLAVVHVGADEDIDWFTDQAHERLRPSDLLTSALTPVIGAHSGPGTIGIMFQANNHNQE